MIQQVLLGVTYGGDFHRASMDHGRLISISESLVVFPSHGIQLETHRGFKHHVLSSSRTFIPFTILQDVVINEALYGWNVRYYIVSLTQPKGDTTILKIVFPVSRKTQPSLVHNGLILDDRVSYHIFPFSKLSTRISKSICQKRVE